jgi:hypothetical protein
MGQRPDRHWPVIGRHTANGLLGHEHGAGTEFGGMSSGHHAGRTCTDHNDICSG